MLFQYCGLLTILLVDMQLDFTLMLLPLPSICVYVHAGVCFMCQGIFNFQFTLLNMLVLRATIQMLDIRYFAAVSVRCVGIVKVVRCR